MNKTFLSLLSAGALVLAACGGDDDAVSIDGPWARATSPGAEVGAAYFEITAAEDDVLVAASVDASVAGEAQIHEVVEADGDMDTDDMDDESMDDMDMDDMDDESMDDMDDESMDDMDDESMDDMDHGGMAPGMTMRELTGGLPLPADETVTLEPGGYHIMLLELAGPLEVGDEFELTLQFEESDDMTITVPVEETAP